MHPNELKNMALVASNAAKREGFSATAQALLDLAMSCDADAKAATFRNHGYLEDGRTPQPSVSRI